MGYLKSNAFRPHAPRTRARAVAHARAGARGRGRLRAPAPRRLAFGDTDYAAAFAQMKGAITSTACPACDAAGHAAQATFDQQMYAIAASWKNRDDFYYLADMDAVMTQGYQFLNQGYALLDAVRTAYGSAPSAPVRDGQDLAYNKMQEASQTALDFQVALNNAKNAGASVVDAPGLKSWVIDTVSAAGYAAYVAAYTRESMPAYAATIIAVLKDFTLAGQVFLSIVKKIAVVAYDAGKVVYKTAVGAFDLVAWLLKYGPYVAGGLGAVWVFSMLGKGSARGA